MCISATWKAIFRAINTNFPGSTAKPYVAGALSEGCFTRSSIVTTFPMTHLNLDPITDRPHHA